MAITVTAGATTDARTARGAPVVVSIMTTINSPTNTQPMVLAGAQAAVLAINKAGGLGLAHHPIALVFCDNQLDPNQAAACARQAIDEKAIADVGSLDLLSTVTQPITDSWELPRIGPYPISTPEYTSPFSYPITAGAKISDRYAGKALVDLGANKYGKIAMVYQDLAAVAALVPYVRQGVKAAGGTWLGDVPVPPSGVTDYAPYAQQLKALNPQTIFFVGNALFDVPLMSAIRHLGIDAQFALASGFFSPPVQRAAGGIFNGAINISTTPPAASAGPKAPGLSAFVQQMRTAQLSGVRGADQLNQQSLNSWLAFQALQQLLAKTPGKITKETVLAALKKAGTINVAGIMPWSPGADGPPEFPRISSATLWVDKVAGLKEVQVSKGPINAYKAFRAMHIFNVPPPSN